MDMTAAAVFRLVEAFHTREGGSPDPKLYLAILNALLDDVSSRVGGLDSWWSNDVSDKTHGRLLLTGTDNRVTFPSDVIDAYRSGVLWEGYPLSVATSIDAMNATRPGWRTAIAGPTTYAKWAGGILLDAIITDTTGKLVVQGLGTLPHFEEEETVNPLTLLVRHDQSAFVDGIVGRLPLEWRTPQGTGDKSEERIKVERAMRQEAGARWEKRVPHIAHGLKVRSAHPEGALH